MPPLLVPVMIAVGVTVVILVVIIGVAYLRRSEAGPPGGGDGTPDACWKFGMIYVNRADPAFWVKKRSGLGYTLNFGHPVSILILLLLIGIIFAISFIPALF